MKKQNNILRVINKLLCITLACSLFHSCADEEIISSTKVETGIPVEVQLGMSISGMSEVSTRSLDENAESQVNDLYVLIFDANSQQKKTGKFFSTDEIVSTTTNKNKGSIVLKTTSGECRIYAVANVATTELTGTNLKSQLDNVSKISDLNNITAALTEVNIQRVQAALSMSGVYKATNQPNKAEGYCVINEEGNVSAGKIELNRLDSHITFKIAVGSEVKTFTPISWQVKNVPLKSTVFPQEKSVFTNSDDFAEESSISKAFGTVTNDKVYRTFDFYMLENVKSAKEYNGEKITADVSNMDIQERQAEYAKREAEEKIKDPDNKDKVINTGTYKFSEPFATYVEIKASMEIAHKEDGKDVTRVANVTYIIHLGGGTDDPANFTSNRNTKYTYKIQINNVDNIVVEVEEDKENRPGEEGDVVDAEVEARTLDAHYNSFVMGFSYNDVADENGKNALQFVVKTPFGTVTNKDQADATSNISNPQDYHWIHFKQNTGKDPDKKLALHNGTIIDIFNLGDDIIKRYNNDTAKDKSKTKQYFYTVFVDEYYYSKPPKGENWGNDATTYWRHFANAADRYIMLVYAPKYSTDNESSYAKARYMLTQRSIQTYYSTESGIALGMEHINETGAATIWGNITDAVSYNGLWNTWQYLKNNNSWDSHVTRTSWDQNMNTFTTQNEAVVVARCLSRNRDENGQAANVRTAWDFVQRPEAWIRGRMGVTGLRTWKELQGEACIDFESAPPAKQQITVSRSFAHELTQYEEIHTSVAAFVSMAAEKLRRQQSLCGEVTVYILTNRHREELPQYFESQTVRPVVPTDDTLELVPLAAKALQRIFRKGYGYKKAGITLSDISSRTGLQTDLFDPVDRARHARLMDAMDATNRTYGRNRVVVAAQGFAPLKMNRQHLSQEYTTDWKQIITVKAD